MLISWSNLILSLVFNLGVIERMKRDCLEKPDISGKKEKIYHETSLKNVVPEKIQQQGGFSHPTLACGYVDRPTCLFV